MKKRILVLFICVCTILFCGCGVAPQYTISQKSDGSVMQMVYLPISGSELAEAGASFEEIAEVSNELKGIFNNYFSNLYTNFVTRVSSDEGLSEVEKMSMLAGCPSQNDMSGKGSFSGISYELNFYSAIHYYYFNSNLYYKDLIEKLKEDTSEVAEGLFLDKTTTTSTSIYGIKTSLGEYIQSRCQVVLTEKTSLADEKIAELVPDTFIYRYGTSTKKLHSNADLVRQVDGIYYHEWNISATDTTRELVTYKYTVNKNVWYASLLLVAIILVFVLLTVAKIKDNKNKPKSPKIIIEQPK